MSAAIQDSILDKSSSYPSVNLALVSSSDGRDVGLDNIDQGVLVLDRLDPGGHLRPPEEGVSTDQQVVLLSIVDEVVGAVEVELASRRLSGVELHAVLGGDLTELLGDEVSHAGLREGVLVDGGTPVQLALGLEERVERGAVAGTVRGCGSSHGAAGGHSGSEDGGVQHGV